MTDLAILSWQINSLMNWTEGAIFVLVNLQIARNDCNIFVVQNSDRRYLLSSLILNLFYKNTGPKLNWDEENKEEGDWPQKNKDRGLCASVDESPSYRRCKLHVSISYLYKNHRLIYSKNISHIKNDIEGKRCDALHPLLISVRRDQYTAHSLRVNATIYFLLQVRSGSFLVFLSKLRYKKLLNRKSEASIRIKIVN